jgi:hypothetical protein
MGMPEVDEGLNQMKQAWLVLRWSVSSVNGRVGRRIEWRRRSDKLVVTKGEV